MCIRFSVLLPLPIICIFHLLLGKDEPPLNLHPQVQGCSTATQECLKRCKCMSLHMSPHPSLRTINSQEIHDMSAHAHECRHLQVEIISHLLEADMTKHQAFNTLLLVVRVRGLEVGRIKAGFQAAYSCTHFSLSKADDGPIQRASGDQGALLSPAVLLPSCSTAYSHGNRQK